MKAVDNLKMTEQIATFCIKYDITVCSSLQFIVEKVAAGTMLSIVSCNLKDWYFKVCVAKSLPLLLLLLSLPPYIYIYIYTYVCIML